MNFELSAEQKMLRDTVRSFTKQKSTTQRFRELREAERSYEPEIWAHMGELGWLSVPFSESDGGFGGDFTDVMVLLEGLGGTLVPEPFIPSVALAGMALALAGTPEQKSTWLAPMIEGTTVLAFAHEERSTRYSPTPIETKAVPDAGAWKLKGRKEFVLAGHIAAGIVVSAATDKGAALFVVDPQADGVSVQRVNTMDAHGAAQIEFDITLPANALVGQPGEGTRAIIEHVLDYGATAACAEAVGVAQAVLDMTLVHLKDREQFGVAIGTFQTLQHGAVDMFVEVQLMRSMAILAAASVGNPNANVRQRAVSAAKAHVNQSGRKMTHAAIQLHGGIGITDEHDVGLYFKRMHALGLVGGDEDHHVRRFASLPGFSAA